MTSSLKITGATRLYVIVGDPIAQVRSPEVFTERFAAAGVNAVMIPAHVPAARFDAVIPALMGLGNLDGVVVTVPFKARMLPFASRVGPAAQCIGAVNVLRREGDGSWSGDMFDGAGFVSGLERKGGRLRGRRVLQFGAGGAGSAIAYALLGAGVQSIRIVDPESGRVESLAKALRTAFPGCDVATATSAPWEANMVVNASPVGMHAGDGLPGAIGTLTADTLVGDVVVSESPTPLIQQAIGHGCIWANGRDMHAGQVDALLGFLEPRPAPAGGKAAH